MAKKKEVTAPVKIPTLGAESTRAFAALLNKTKTALKDVIVKPDTNLLIKKVVLGSPKLNYLFSGFSYNRIHQFQGPESGGKSSICCYIAGQLQKIFPEKPVVLYIDFERTFDPTYAQRLGLDVSEDKFVLIHAENAETAFTLAEEFLRTNAVCCIIFDSDATAPTAAQFQDEVGKASFGGLARLASDELKRLNIMLNKYNANLLWISQERDSMEMYGDPNKATGGKAIRFFASTRNRVRRKEVIYNGNDQVGIVMAVSNKKNKTGIPWREVELHLYFDGGFKTDDEYVEFFKIYGLIQQAGAYYKSEKYGFSCQGMDALVAYMKANPTIYDELKKEVDNLQLIKTDADKDVAPDDEAAEAEDEEDLSDELEDSPPEISTL